MSDDFSTLGIGLYIYAVCFVAALALGNGILLRRLHINLQARDDHANVYRKTAFDAGCIFNSFLATCFLMGIHIAVEVLNPYNHSGNPYFALFLVWAIGIVVAYWPYAIITRQATFSRTGLRRFLSIMFLAILGAFGCAAWLISMVPVTSLPAASNSFNLITPEAHLDLFFVLIILLGWQFAGFLWIASISVTLVCMILGALLRLIIVRIVSFFKKSTHLESENASMPNGKSTGKEARI
ncbi:MAG TPA: hypothetical protein VKM55_09215 [Candidatus Lokiarchaeia archaeon]|nr:hypothetical protein [Candidatus Lokiarchaeia archaeon]